MNDMSRIEINRDAVGLEQFCATVKIKTGDRFYLPVPDRSDLEHLVTTKKQLREAAVLVPLVERSQGTMVILTTRTANMSSHAGQIAFPGGKIDAGDEGPVEAAMREAFEEIGLQQEFISPFAQLDEYITNTGYRVLPVLARIDPECTLTLNRDEVDDVFEVPLGFLMHPANHQLVSRLWQGQMRTYYAMPWKDHYIWGVTAGIFRNLYQAVYTT